MEATEDYCSSSSSSDSESSNEAAHSIDLDAVLEYIGEFGKYQKVLYYTVCLPTVLTTVLALSVVFTAAVPRTRCYLEHCDSPSHPDYSDAFKDKFADFAIPKGQSRCGHYVWANKTSPECSAENYLQDQVVNCSKRLYDRSEYVATVVSEFDLACGQEWKVPLVESVMFFGVLVSAVTFGFLADQYGRRHVLMTALLVTCISAGCLALSENYWFFVVFQFMVAFGNAGVFQTAFILAVESVGKSKRVFCGIVIEFFFVAGEVLLTGAAYVLCKWRNIIIFATVPLCGFLCGWPWLPESVRWQLANDKHHEAAHTIHKMARCNGKGQNFCLQDFYRPLVRHDHRDTVLDMAKSKVMVLRFANTCFCWMVVTMVYYGLSLNATNLAGSPYTNFLLVSLVEIPGYAASYITMEKLGRKASTSLSLIVCGLACFLSACVDEVGGGGEKSTSLTYLDTASFLIGKLGVTCTFGTIYVYTSELFPTSIRTACVGSCSMCGRVGAIIAPYIAGLAWMGAWIPMTIFGTFALISGLFIYFLPESLGRALPETIEEAINFGSSSTTSNNISVNAVDSEDESTPLLQA